jgi:hypothetical protein
LLTPFLLALQEFTPSEGLAEKEITKTRGELLKG